MQKSEKDIRLLFVLFVAALLFRLFGLSHDLHLEMIYHPDTPKQIRAVEQFLSGDYLVFQGHSDYDGYPFFNSHLVEYLVRAYMGLATLWLKWTGAWTGPVEHPSFLTLFWITRTWNAVLSALTAPLLFIIGRRFNRATAWCAAVLAVLSPLEISAAHFASNDTATAFFSVLALWFGFRIAERGRWTDLAGGAISVAAAFSSKYHGAMCFMPVFIGHIMYSRKHGGILSSAAIRRLLFTGLTGIIAIFLTSPALLVHTEAAFESIVRFMRYTANFALSDEMKAMPAHHRFWMGLSENIPVLADAVGWPVILSSLLSLLLLKREPRLGLILAVPVLLVFVGLAGKPHLHQAHHAPVIPYLILAASVAWLGVSNRWTDRRWYRLATVMLIGWSVMQSALFTVKELMSFYVADTRRVAQTWMHDSIPAGVQWLTGSYTLSPPPNEGPVLPVYAIAQSGNNPIVLTGFVEWAYFSHFDNTFSRFINRDIHVHTVDSEHLRLPEQPPYLMPLPGTDRDTVLSLDVPWFGRSTRVRDVTRWEPLRVWAVSSQAVETVWVVVQTAGEPVSMTMQFGNRKEIVHLPSRRHHVMTVDEPDRFRIPLDHHVYYRWRADVTWGSARVILMTRPDDVAMWALENGVDDIAVATAPAVSGNSFATRFIRAATDPNAVELRNEVIQTGRRILATPSAWVDEFGMSELWLSSVPYFKMDAGHWKSFRDPAAGLKGWITSDLRLSPGIYQVSFRTEDQEIPSVRVSDQEGRVLQESLADSNGTVRLHVQWEQNPLTILLSGLTEPPLEMAVRPDSRAMLVQWIDRLQQGAVATNAAEQVSLPQPKAIFDDAIQVVDVMIDSSHVRPGGYVYFDLEMWVSEKVRRPDRYSVWLRLVDASGETVARYDRHLEHFLRSMYVNEQKDLPRERIILPATLPPGTYEIQLGLWIPSQRKRSEVTASDWDSAERYVVVEKIEVGDYPKP